MPPSNSVRDRIVDDLVVAMEAIAAGASYHYTIAQVFRWKTPPAGGLEFPSVVVADLDERVAVLNYALDDRTLSLTVQAIGNAGAYEGGTDGPDDVARKMLADLQVAAQVDTTRGGLAIVTNETANRIAVDEPAEPFVVVEVDFEVQYRTKRGDPTVPNA